MKRLAAALSLLSLSGALVFPSAAAPFALSQSDAITQDVSLAPTDAPNGEYAYINENDDLVVDLTAANPNLDAEGVNPDGVTMLANVFRIHYNGTRYAHVWITDESDAVTFTVDGEPIDSRANNVTLGPNQSVAVGLVVDTTGDGGDGLIDDMEVHARVAEPEDVAGASVGTDGAVASTDAGDDAGDAVDTPSTAGGTAIQVFAPSPTARTITITDPPTENPVTVDLGGMPIGSVDPEGTPPANLTLDSIALTSEGGSVLSLRLAATRPAAPDAVGIASLGAFNVTETGGTASTATLRFSVSRAYLDARGIEPSELAVFRRGDGDTSTLPVRVVDAEGARVRFEADTPGFSTFTVAALRPSIGVAEASLSNDTITVNESATVTARVVNDGRAPGNRTVTLTLDGEVVAERTVDLGVNESTTVTFEVTPDRSGEYAVAVADTVVGTLTVENAAGTATTPADAGTASGAGGDAAPAGTEGPVGEPAGLGLAEVGGLALVVALGTAVIVLARRVTR